MRLPAPGLPKASVDLFRWPPVAAVRHIVFWHPRNHRGPVGRRVTRFGAVKPLAILGPQLAPLQCALARRRIDVEPSTKTSTRNSRPMLASDDQDKRVPSRPQRERVLAPGIIPLARMLAGILAT